MENSELCNFLLQQQDLEKLFCFICRTELWEEGVDWIDTRQRVRVRRVHEIY